MIRLNTVEFNRGRCKPHPLCLQNWLFKYRIKQQLMFKEFKSQLIEFCTGEHQAGGTPSPTSSAV